MVLHVHKSHTDHLSLNFTDIGNEFVKGSPHRQSAAHSFKQIYR